MVPMRDGVKLATDVFRPDAPGRYPVLVTRGPYGKDGYVNNPGHSIWFFAQHGYVVVSQDCRARFESEGDNYDPLFKRSKTGTTPWSGRRVNRGPTEGWAPPASPTWGPLNIRWLPAIRSRPIFR